MKIKPVLIILATFTILFWPFLFGFGLVAGILALTTSAEEENTSNYHHHWGDEAADTTVMSIPIYGPILDEKPDSLGSFDPFFTPFATFGTDVKELLYELAQDDSIDGVILEINSPGGTVTGSKAIADGVAYYRESTGKPIQAFGSGVVASGSYWAGISADTLTVETGSLVGSIGVIGGQFSTYTGVTSLSEGVLGSGVSAEDISVTTITSGEGKDFGNPFRPASKKELALAQESTNQVYDIFTSYVSQRRSISKQEIVDSIGAYIYGESQAKQLKLIDEVGSREDAYQMIAAQLNVDHVQIVRKINDISFFESLFGAVTKFGSPQASTVQTCVHTSRVVVYMGNVADLCF